MNETFQAKNDIMQINRLFTYHKQHCHSCNGLILKRSPELTMPYQQSMESNKKPSQSFQSTMSKIEYRTRT